MTAEKQALAALTVPVAGRLRQAALLSALSALGWPVQAALVAFAFGALLAGQDFSPMAIAAGFACAGLVRIFLNILSDRLHQQAAEQVVGELRAEILAAEARAAGIVLTEGSAAGPGAVAALAADKLEMLTPWLTRYQAAQARVMLVPPVIFLLALWHSWAVALVFVVAGPLIPLFMALIGRAAQAASGRHLAGLGSLGDLLIERLSILADIRLLNAERQVEAEFAAQTEDLRQRTMAVLRIAFLSSTVLELLAAVAVAMVAVLVGFTLLGLLDFGFWRDGLTVGAGLFLLMIAPDFFQPLRDLAAAWHDRAAALAVAADIAGWRRQMANPLPGRGGRAVALSGPASVVFSGVIAPGGVRLADFSVAAGEAVALTGRSGAGKSTALRLIAGLSLPEAGEVLVAGLPLTAERADGWRARMGWMPQVPHFLNISLHQNVLLGRAGTAEAALTAAAAQGVVAGLPHGLATRLGENGAGLSGGEARRLTLARALQGGPGIILADEPTADLDAETAAQVTAALLAAVARGATLIVATHDPALMARLNRVIAVEAA